MNTVAEIPMPNDFRRWFLPSKTWLRMVARPIAVWLSIAGCAAGAPPRPAVEVVAGGASLSVSWDSESVTHAPPFWHYEFQVQTSANLADWADSGPPVPGGVSAEPVVVRSALVPAGDGAGFVRLAYRLNAAGADLRGADLSGADLRGADLTGADLTGADLTGANLAGATLTGANIAGVAWAGANLDGVNLDGHDLGNLDLRDIQGTPLLTRLTVPDIGSLAADALPRFPYRPKADGWSALDADVPGLAVSQNTAVIMLKDGVTVGQLNALLQNYGATIIGCSPRDATLGRGLLFARFATTTPLELFNLTQTLAQEPVVEAAVQDILLGPDLVTNDSSTDADWKWTAATGPPVGGNWGLERARVPQLWNLNRALEKRPVQRVPTGILDSEFFVHDDLAYLRRLGPASALDAPGLGGSPPATSTDHGVHVAGIAGAIHGNPKGIDGVNPYADLIVFQTTNHPYPLLQQGLGLQAAPSAAMLLEEARDFLRQAPEILILNSSLGFNWHQAFADPVTGDPPGALSAVQLGRVTWLADSFGKQMAEIADANSAVLFVTSAGNASELVPAGLNSPFSNAALRQGAPNIVVVEAHDEGGLKAPFSNTDQGTVAAPGTNILSASFFNAYTYKQGTSMAAPFVTGLAGYLLAVDPALDPENLILLLKASASGGKNVDAFASAMLIDNLSGGDPEVLRMLLDNGDGTRDGCLRIDPRAPIPGWDRTFTPATGAEHVVDLAGDGEIDMADFRRWRDWLYLGEELGEGGGPLLPNAIDDPFALKLDANGDGVVTHGAEITYFPRGDFNGDGIMDRGSKVAVPGALADVELTDLEVLIQSGLWDDAEVTDPEVLKALIDSVDLWVSAANFFATNGDLGISSAGIGIYLKGSTTPLEVPGGAGWIAFKQLGALAPQFEFTVPTGATYFVSSEPVDVPGSGGEQVLLRSISDQHLADSRRGADLVIDLSCLQMTGKAKAEQGANLRDDIANTNVALEPVAAEVTGEGGSSPEPGSRADAQEDGSTSARVDAAMVEGFDPGLPTTFTSEVIWRRAFIKNPAFAAPKFHIYPLRLVLGGLLPGDGDLRAEAEIIIEKRRGAGPWIEVVTLAAAGSGNSVDGFQKDSETLNDPFMALEPVPSPKDMTAEGTYTQDEFTGTFPVDDVPVNASFEVRYRLKATAYGTGLDNTALAEIADPFEYGSGASFGYGSFGSLAVPQSVANGVVTFFAHEPFYYVLERIEADGTHTPVDMMLGFEGEASMSDPAPPAGATPDSYFIRNIPLTKPGDGDGDGIDDVYELQHPAFLDPLDPADAGRDQDGDEFTNLAEYQNGTDPEVPDQATLPTGLYAGVLVAAEVGEHLRLADANGDGFMDLLSLQESDIIVAPGNPDGTWQTVLRSTIGTTFGATPVDWLLADFNGDGKLDAVLADSSGQRLLRVDGVGDGHFGNESAIDLGGRPDVLVLSDVTGDGRSDILVGLRNYKVRCLVAQPGGGLQAAATDLDFISVPTGVAVGRFDGDAHPDLAVTLTNHKVGVYRGNGDGTFVSPGVELGTGFSPQDAATGDINGDGKTDLVTVNFTTGGTGTRDLSLFLGNGDGTFQPEVRRIIGVRSGDIEVLEMTGDDYADVILADTSLRGYTLLPGTAGGLGAEVPVFAGSADGVATGDWNGDGAADLLSKAGDRVLILPGDGLGGFVSRVDIDVSDRFTGRVAAVVLVEADGDASPELAVLRNESSFSNTTSTMAVWDSPIAAGAGSSPRLVVEVGAAAKSVACGDFNGDGRADYAVASGLNFAGNGVNELKLFLGNADGTAVTAGTSYPLPERPVQVLAGDVNGDGSADLLVTLESGMFLPFLASGGGSFAAGAPVALGTSCGAAILADVNGDARAELCAAAALYSGSPYLKVMTLAQNGTWSELFSAPAPGDLTAIAFADVGGGAPELLAAGFERLDAYPRSGLTFGAKRTVIAGDTTFNGAALAVTDANADGRPDIATLLGVHLALTDGGFDAVQPYWLGTNPRTVTAADLNGDGKPDIVALTDTGVAVLPHR